MHLSILFVIKTYLLLSLIFIISNHINTFGVLLIKLLKNKHLAHIFLYLRMLSSQTREKQQLQMS